MPAQGAGDAPELEPRSPSAGFDNKVLVGAAAAQAAISFIILGLPAIGPQLAERFGLSLAALGALLVTVQFGSGIALIVAAKVMDRWGSRAGTLAGTGLAVAGLALAAGAQSTVPLFIGLLLAGIGAAAIPVSGARAIFRIYSAPRRAWALGVRQMAVPLGGVIGAVAVPALNAVGGTTLVLGTGAVLVALLGAGFSAVSDQTRVRQHDSVRIVRGIWHGPGLVRLFVVTLTYLFVLQTVLIYTVPAMRAAGFSAFEAGAAYFLVNLTAIVSRVVWGRIADRNYGTRRNRTLMEVGVLAGIGALLFGLALHGGLTIALFAVVFFGFAALGWNAIVYAMAGEWTRPELAGSAFAVLATVVFAGSAVVGPLIGALADLAGWDVLWLTTAAIAFIGTVVASTLPDRGARPRSA